MASADFQAEQAFARSFLNTIGRQPITYNDDYRQPLQSSLRKVPVLGIPVPPVPERKVGESSTAGATVTLTFKSLKPPVAYTLPVSLTDSVLSIKNVLHEKHSDVLPAAEHQRILLKGKALADQKLLKEYNVKDGDTLNLVFKAAPAAEKAQEPTIAAPQPVTPASSMSSPFGSVGGSLDPNAKPSGGRKHQRIPSVVLSPSPSNDTLEEKPKEITLDLDSVAADPISPVLRDELSLASTYHDTVANPEFWERLVAFLRAEFVTESDFHQAFEDFLCATKGALTANQIAKIRDHVKIYGMAGQ
ncbi:ubiquitin family protein [Coprinopsis cinerea okayama7|uniref:Ubiquitin family protein n=1 Tax=Coprinopsis cinerea (strain Okayama-7 / 130 / ATCC MYA-4618 / FGSC 9003) TaxID=240176 RepID=A8NCB6_COPC7|nr:ubiquitin family protein [Coprinopsis cinerea okayama7\|eukprot:XP_001832460.1 ubiquitin family protein [Coprinopsis cinerea okayama7\